MARGTKEVILYLNSATPQGIGRQRATVTAFAAERGYTVVGECADEDNAASRPGLGGVFDAVKNAASRLIVLIDRAERLAEDPVEQEAIVGVIEARGGQVESVKNAEPVEGAEDIRRAVAYAERLRAATLGGKLSAARKRHGSRGGRPPYGSKPGEEAIVALIHRLAREREWRGYRIARKLNEMGHRTRKGTLWSGPMVAKILDRD